mgnify:CR=1 FL=1
MGTKDTITKDYMANNRVFADVFNHMLYKGKNIIDPDTLHPLDTTALAVPYGFGTSEVPVQKFRDEFKSLNVMHDDSRIYLLLGIENQSEQNFAMPVKNMVYDALEYAAGRKFRQITQRSKAMAFYIRRISHRLLQG